MTSDSIKPLVFISYAHLDEPAPPEDFAAGKICWLSFVMKFLRPGVKGRKYQVWMDRLMPGGADWNPEIEAKARACDIFVLLVSANSTGSDYILDKEIPSSASGSATATAFISIPCSSTGRRRPGSPKSTTRTFARGTPSPSRVCRRASAAGPWPRPPTRSPMSRKR
jgi:hypothetical protein